MESNRSDSPKSSPPLSPGKKILVYLSVIVLLAGAMASVILFPPQSMGTDKEAAQVAPQQTQNAADISRGDTVNAQGNTAGNILNYGYAAIQGDWIYYSNQSDGGRIYKIRTDGKKETRVSDNTGCYINVIGQTVYYISSGSIWQVQTDGNGETQLISGMYDNLYVLDGCAYYEVLEPVQGEANTWTSAGICKTDLSSGATIEFTDDEYFASLNVVDDIVYYVGDSGTVNRIEPSGEPFPLFQIPYPHLCAADGGFVFIEQGNAYGIGYDGEGKQLLISGIDTNVFNVADGVLYYLDPADGNALYRVGLDGSDRRKLDNAEGYSICVAGDWIYYKRFTSENKFQFCRMRTDGSGLQPID